MTMRLLFLTRPICGGSLGGRVLRLAFMYPRLSLRPPTPGSREKLRQQEDTNLPHRAGVHQVGVGYGLVQECGDGARVRGEAAAGLETGAHTRQPSFATARTCGQPRTSVAQGTVPCHHNPHVPSLPTGKDETGATRAASGCSTLHHHNWLQFCCCALFCFVRCVVCCVGLGGQKGLRVVLWCAVLCGAVLSCAVLCCVVMCCDALCWGTVQHNTTQHVTTQHDTSQHNTPPQQSTAQHSTAQHNTTLLLRRHRPHPSVYL